MKAFRLVAPNKANTNLRNPLFLEARDHAAPWHKYSLESMRVGNLRERSKPKSRGIPAERIELRKSDDTEVLSF